MKEFFFLLKSFKFRALFLNSTENGVIQFFRYAFVGAISTVADFGVLWALQSAFDSNIYVETGAAFCVGLAVNYTLSRFFVFPHGEKCNHILFEFIVYLSVGLVGLGFTELFMYIFNDLFRIHYLISKLIATVIVLAWNFGSKKIILYRKKV